jgi:alkanesulfonate monooxygenase SsuD/methylene tetrahydromethanopterin reductase-like flavin-dependent oxidoreductase (luciferase family)
MQFGGAMFFTDYSMSAMELAHALEERGFESVWAPEHSHIPLSRKTPFPGGGELPNNITTRWTRSWCWPLRARLPRKSN